MLKTTCLAIIALALALTGSAQAECQDLARFELSLAGYHVGMTYDEALLLRPLDYIEETVGHSADSSYHLGHAKNVILDEFSADLQIYFRENRVQKVLVRFHPAELQAMIRMFQRSFGQGKNLSKVLMPQDGSQIRQTTFHWDFPTAKVYLVGISTNTDFATASLIAKQAEQSTAEMKEDAKPGEADDS